MQVIDQERKYRGKRKENEKITEKVKENVFNGEKSNKEKWQIIEI